MISKNSRETYKQRYLASCGAEKKPYVSYKMYTERNRLAFNNKPNLKHFNSEIEIGIKPKLI